MFIESMYPYDRDLNPYSWTESEANVERNPVIRRVEAARCAAIREIRQQYSGAGAFAGIKTAVMLWWKTDKLMDQKLNRSNALEDLVNRQIVEILDKKITPGSSTL